MKISEGKYYICTCPRHKGLVAELKSGMLTLPSGNTIFTNLASAADSGLIVELTDTEAVIYRLTGAFAPNS